jgi:uncharacterized membrane protein
MWDRKELKDRAKQVLRASYWKAFLVSLLLAFITGGIPSCSLNTGFNRQGGSSGGTAWSGVSDGTGDALNGALIAIIVIIIIVAIFAILVTFAFRIFLTAPLEAGIRKYFIHAAQDEVNLNHLGYSFARGKYFPIVKGMLWRDFLNILWYLLLIVPGIVKTYAYSLVPYILADNPNIGTKRAVQLSNRMTRGHKWSMFVLDLSFIVWFLLGLLALVVGTLFVLPYYNATRAELYLVLRKKALDEGICSRPELNIQEFE